MCRPDDSFSARGRKTSFEYDASLYKGFSCVRIALLNPEDGRNLIMVPVGSIIFTQVLHSLVLMVYCWYVPTRTVLAAWTPWIRRMGTQARTDDGQGVTDRHVHHQCH